jgi:hypothetical protein
MVFRSLLDSHPEKSLWRLPKLSQVGTYRSARVALKGATLSENARVRDLFQLGTISGMASRRNNRHRRDLIPGRRCGVALGLRLVAMLREPRRPQLGINSHMNSARGHVDQPGPGLAGRGPFADLKSPLPDVRLAGGGDAVLHAPVDHDGSRVGRMAQGEVFVAAINPDDYGKRACESAWCLCALCGGAVRICPTSS